MTWRSPKHDAPNSATDLVEDFAAEVMAFDAAAVGKARASSIEVELTRLGNRLAEADAAFRLIQRETSELRQIYAQHLQAAEILQSRLSKAPDIETAAETEAKLDRLVDRLAQLKRLLELEERESREVEAWRAALRRAFDELARKINRAQRDSRFAQRPTGSAGLRMVRPADRDRPVDQDRHPCNTAGLIGAISALRVVLDGASRRAAVDPHPLSEWHAALVGGRAAAKPRQAA